MLDQSDVSLIWGRGASQSGESNRDSRSSMFLKPSGRYQVGGWPTVSQLDGAVDLRVLCS
jgi:hypothetical protein